jgi:hypothetical protein
VGWAHILAYLLVVADRAAQLRRQVKSKPSLPTRLDPTVAGSIPEQDVYPSFQHFAQGEGKSAES